MDRLRRQRGVPGDVRRAARARCAGPSARRDAAVRFAVDVTGQCGGAVARGPGLVPGAPRAIGVRALVLDPANRVLLTRFDWPDKSVWAPPGGGVEAGETDERALRRELAEESGLRHFELGPCIWTRTHW